MIVPLTFVSRSCLTETMTASRAIPWNQPRIVLGFAWFLCAALWQPVPEVSALLPAGFVDEDVVRISGVVDMAFVGTQMLAVTKEGTVHRFDVGDPTAVDGVEILNIRDRICLNGERG